MKSSMEETSDFYLELSYFSGLCGTEWADEERERAGWPAGDRPMAGLQTEPWSWGWPLGIFSHLLPDLQEPGAAQTDDGHRWGTNLWNLWNLKAWIYNYRKFLLMLENLHLKSCILTRLTASFNITDSFTPKSKIICRNLKNIPKEIRFFKKYFNKYIKWTLQKPCLVSRMRNVHVGGSTEKKTASGYNPVLHHIALYVALAMSHSDPPVHPSSTCFYLFFFFFFRFFKSNPWSPPTMFSGVVMLDREEPSLSSIMEKIVDEMVEKEEIRPVDREGVFKALTQNRR